MQTPDGAWRVEIYRVPRSRDHWYRLIHGDNVVEQLTIGGVQRLLAEAGVDIGALVDVDDDAAPPRHGAA
jgi:bifunctional non-homologous end joining protein LigD